MSAAPPKPAGPPPSSEDDAHRETGSRPAVAWATAALAIAAAILAQAWVLEFVVADRADPVTAWISDLAAESETHGALFSALALAGGLLTIGAGLGLWGLLAPPPRSARWGAVALVLVGAGGVLDGLLPFECAETLQPGCAERLEREGVTLEYALHATESVGTVVALGVALVLLAHGTRHRPGWRLTARVTAAFAVVWIAIALDLGVQALPSLEDGRGIAQRAGQVLLGLWLVLVAVTVLRAERGAAGGAATRRA